MTERWQRELKRLRILHPPVDLWEQVRAGPRARSSSSKIPPLSTVLAITLALAVAGTGFAFLARAFLGGASREPGAPQPAAVSNGKIAFTSLRDRSEGYFEVYLVNPGGTDMTNITNTTPDVADIAWQWSPDGTKLAFVSSVDNGPSGTSSDIFVMNPDGTGRRALTNKAGDENSPMWSPDGSQIAFVGDDPDADIYVVSTDGSGEIKLTDGLGDERSPVWSPDGTQIAFAVYVDGGSAIYTVTPNGTAATPLTDGFAFDELPSWSPDGTRIAFQSDRDGEEEIYVMNADGSGQIKLTNAPTDRLDCCIGQPMWSPEGASIAFDVLQNGNWDIYVVNADGTDQRNVTGGPGDEMSPTWSPTGLQIAFAGSDLPFAKGDNAGTFDIHVINPDGSGEARLTEGAQALGGVLTWQPVFAQG